MISKLDIQSRLGLLFLAFVLLVIVSVGTTYWGIEAQKEDALDVNLAGRQRMLIQQITRQALEIERQSSEESKLALQETITTFDQSLQALRDGGSVPYLTEITTTLPPTHDPAIREQLDLLAFLWSEFRADLMVILMQEPSTQSFQHAVQSLENRSPLLVQQADVVVREYVDASADKVNRVRLIQIAFLSSALILLGLGGLVTHRSVLQPIKKLGTATERIGAGDLNTRIEVAGPSEIRTLSEALEMMRTQLESSQQEAQAWMETLEERVAQRTRELEALYTVIRDISSRLDIKYVFNSVTSKARQLLDGDLAYLCLLDEEGQILNLQSTSGPQGAVEQSSTRADAILPGKILSGDHAVLCGIEGCQGYCEIMASRYRSSHIAAPLHAGGQLIGALCVGSSKADFFPDESLSLLTELANAAAVALENARLYEQAERTATLEERQRLAADMHDGLAQTLSYLQMKVDMLQEQLKEGKTGPALATLESCHRAIEQASQETRRAIASLQEDIPRVRPLQEQLSELVAEVSQGKPRIQWLTTMKTPLLLPPEDAEQVLRVVREALLNAYHHSRAEHIQVCLEQKDVQASVCVHDDGLGFNPQAPSTENGCGHFGLSIMRARAARLGGQVVIDSAPGSGTKISLIWPMREDEAKEGSVA